MAVPAPATTLLALAADRLRQAGLADARREAWGLWADLQGTSSAAVRLRGDVDVAPEMGALYLARVARRAAGEPRAYVSGVAGFRRLVLSSDRRALIPRPETEGLVDRLLARRCTGRVADIGTGTGCLALSLATEGSFDEVLAVDRSAEAVALARSNWAAVAAAHAGGIAPMQFLQGDLTTPLASGALDALVANPPYLSEREYISVDPSVRDWEPRMALASGPDGLDATTGLLEDGRRVLRPGGWLVLEVDCTRAAETARRAVLLGWRDVVVDNDLFGRERYLLARRSERS